MASHYLGGGGAETKTKLYENKADKNKIQLNGGKCCMLLMKLVLTFKYVDLFFFKKEKAFVYNSF